MFFACNDVLLELETRQEILPDSRYAHRHLVANAAESSQIGQCLPGGQSDLVTFIGFKPDVANNTSEPIKDEIFIP